MTAPTYPTAGPLAGTIGSAEAAARAGVSIPTIHRWVQAGILPARRTATRQLRIRIEDIDALSAPVAVTP